MVMVMVMVVVVVTVGALLFKSSLYGFGADHHYHYCMIKHMPYESCSSIGANSFHAPSPPNEGY